MRKTTAKVSSNWTSAMLVAASAAILPATALAQAGALEEIIVTASKRTVSLQDVAMTVTAFGEETIREANINNADDLAVLTPALSLNNNNSPGTAAFRIRGIGTSQSDVALEPSVGIFVDEVYLNRSGLGISDLTDIERIEVPWPAGNFIRQEHQRRRHQRFHQGTQPRGV